MIFRILTLFPEVLDPYIHSSIIGRSVEEKQIEISLINFRDYSDNKHNRVDDTSYGGGPGMVLQCDPLYRAIKSVHKDGSRLIFLTPQGSLFNQQKAEELAQEDELILVSGHYEGFDHRIFELFDHEKISIGDYILTNGGLAALVLLDCVARTKNEVLNNPESLTEESFSNGLLEYSQYTKPSEFMGIKVPDVLLGGHHKEIERWRRRSSLVNTLKTRPELLEDVALSWDDLEFLVSYITETI
ncbi:MAG TPA: tRNA (guanosine(37)-N1)-methyltransferase TrmD [Spirochaetes bacterium]|nr:tRNA (guanosine(37)-N1)-methyltransferase TrmD [Spirochaetota bacterium]